MVKSCNDVYVLLMRRWGDSEGHTYVRGVFGDKEMAEKIGAEEKEYRGGKYEPDIVKVNYIS